MSLTMTLLSSPNGADNSQRRTSIYGTATLSGSYTAGGEAINWTTINNAAGSGDALIPTLPPPTPLWVEFQMGVPGVTGPAYAPLLLYNYTTGKLEIYGMNASAAEGNLLEELAAGSYGTNLTSATLYWKAEFQYD